MSKKTPKSTAGPAQTKREAPASGKAESKISTSEKTYNSWLLWASGAAILLVLILRLRILDFPLERDEGGFAYIGERLFSGKLLYTDLLDNKLPGLYFLYWLFSWLPGDSNVRVHIGLFLVHLGALWCFYSLMRRIFSSVEMPHSVPSPTPALLATAVFAVGAVSASVFGFAAHATQLLLLPLMAGLGLLWQAEGRWLHYASAGLCLGLAFIVKQPAAVFVVFAVVAILLESGSMLQRILRAGVLGACSLIPFGLVALYFSSQGRWADFWHWTYELPAQQSTKLSEVKTYLDYTIPVLLKDNWPLWIGGLVATGVLWRTNMPSKAKIWMTGLVVTGLGSTCIGAGFIPHYFVTAIPCLAAALAAVSWWAFQRSKTVGTALGIAIVWLPILLQFEYFLMPNMPKTIDKSYHWQGFAELQAIGKELKKRLQPGQKVAMLGSEPQMYGYTESEAFTPHLFLYPVMRNPKNQTQILEEYWQAFDLTVPDYVVIPINEASWGAKNFSEIPQFKQIWQKLTSQYEMIGRANVGQKPLNIVWDGALKGHQPPKVPPIFVFRKK
jgi:hypothetical protein